MSSVSGHRMPLSIPRRMVCDLLHASRNVPIITFARRMDLAVVAAARKRVAPSPAWSLLFAKAFSTVAAKRPEFRRAYLPFPWPRLWQADESVATIAVEREYHGEPAVFFGFIKAADKLPLSELAAVLNEWRIKPVEEVRAFYRQIRAARLPLPLRRFMWFYGSSWSGKLRAKHFGTFGVSLTGSSGATALNLIHPLAVSINTDVIQDDGAVDVRMHFDHRVLDGMPVARALEELEETFHTDIVAELNAMAETHRGESLAA